MAATLTASVAANISWTYTSSSAPYSVNGNSYSYSTSLTSGTGASGTADLIYFISTTIAASGNTTHDLVGGSTDCFGTTITMARLKYLFIKHTTDTTATSITVGNATNPVNLFSATTTTISIRNGGILLLGVYDATGIAMTGASSDTIKIVNADASNVSTINVVYIGSSA